jgi:hypothetical protein
MAELTDEGSNESSSKRFKPLKEGRKSVWYEGRKMQMRDNVPFLGKN